MIRAVPILSLCIAMLAIAVFLLGRQPVDTVRPVTVPDGSNPRAAAIPSNPAGTPRPSPFPARDAPAVSEGMAADDDAAPAEVATDAADAAAERPELQRYRIGFDLRDTKTGEPITEVVEAAWVPLEPRGFEPFAYPFPAEAHYREQVTPDDEGRYRIEFSRVTPGAVRITVHGYIPRDVPIPPEQPDIDLGTVDLEPQPILYLTVQAFDGTPWVGEFTVEPWHGYDGGPKYETDARGQAEVLWSDVLQRSHCVAAFPDYLERGIGVRLEPTLQADGSYRQSIQRPPAKILPGYGRVDFEVTYPREAAVRPDRVMAFRPHGAEWVVADDVTFLRDPYNGQDLAAIAPVGTYRFGFGRHQYWSRIVPIRESIQKPTVEIVGMDTHSIELTVPEGWRRQRPIEFANADEVFQIDGKPVTVGGATEPWDLLSVPWEDEYLPDIRRITDYYSEFEGPIVSRFYFDEDRFSPMSILLTPPPLGEPWVVELPPIPAVELAAVRFELDDERFTPTQFVYIYPDRRSAGVWSYSGRHPVDPAEGGVTVDRLLPGAYEFRVEHLFGQEVTARGSFYLRPGEERVIRVQPH